MDRAHRLGQTKQVTVYRLICKGTIEERILERAREKSEIQRMVIQGGSFKGQGHDKAAVSLKQGGEQLKPKEVVSLLLDDDEMQSKLMASVSSSGTSTPVNLAGKSPSGKKRKWDESEGSEPALSRPDSPCSGDIAKPTEVAVRANPSKKAASKRPSSVKKSRTSKS